MTNAELMMTCTAYNATLLNQPKDSRDQPAAMRAALGPFLERTKALEEALRAWVEKECDYMRINNLGDPEAQPHVIWSRALLKETNQ